MKSNTIAIVGMACRYPDANSPTELWHNVLSRRRAFRRIPACRVGSEYFGPRDDPDRAYVTHAAVLRDWEFHRETFGVPGPLHRAVDHTHWLALETAAGALADAGHPLGEGLERDNVGVVFGNTLTGEFARASSMRLRWPFIADAAARSLHEQGLQANEASEVLGRMEVLFKRSFPDPGDETLAGSLSNTIAGRICNHFDFHGTGFTVDGACSSSLVAVMMACHALIAGELDFALAGAVDLSLDPFELVGFSRLGALATDDMRVYDARPTGFLPGEGCGVIALVRAEDAERLGLRTYGHIVGWASSSDGSGGLTRPAVAGQALAIRRACRMASVPPSAIALIEGHGTGTAVGDQVELQALTEVRACACEPAALGTVKANIGHTKAAAGMAGLIKATLASYHRVLPPTTGCVEPHQLLQRDKAPIRVLTEPEPWRDTTPRAGISSMGFGGINVHIVIEGATSSPQVTLADTVRRWSTDAGRYEIVMAEADSPALLADRLVEISQAARALSCAELRDVAATEWRRIADQPKLFRAGMLAARPEELAAAAEFAAIAIGNWDGRLRVDRNGGYALGSGEPRVGLLFPGQAAPTRSTLSWWAKKFDLPLLAPDTTALMALGSTAQAQPAIVRQSLAGIAWLQALAVNPVAAVGHSLGEISALSWAGALSAQQALDFAARRGRIMSVHGDRGSLMASLGADADTVRPLLSGTSAVIAGYNAPNITTVSGMREDVDIVLARAAQNNVPATILKVSHGFHGPTMANAREPVRHLLADFPLAPPEKPVISTITGHQLDASVDHLRDLLIDQLTTPVQFQAAIAEVAGRCDLLVETGPGTILSELAEANDIAIPVVSMDCGGNDRNHAMATAALAAASADLGAFFANRPYRTLSVSDQPRFLVNPCEDRAGWSDGDESTISKPFQEPRKASVELSPGTTDSLEALVNHLSETLELPIDSITASSAFLTDLHLSSLQAVQTLTTVSASLGKQSPEVPFSLAEATIGQVADLIAETPALESTCESDLGVRSWVRAFEPGWLPFTAEPAAPGAWHIHAPGGHWLQEYAAADGQTPIGLAAVLTHEDPTEVAVLLSRVSDLEPERLFLLHDGHAAAAGIARSVAMELVHCSVTVVEVPDVAAEQDPQLLAAVSRNRYLELRTRQDGQFQRATVRPRRLGSGAPPYLGSDDICLITGGVQGIAAHAGRAVARQTGCKLMFLGRTPACDDGIVEAISHLNRDIDAHYFSCDVADESSVEHVVSEVRNFGDIRGLIHAAGINEPRRLADINAASLVRTLRPKVTGVRTLLKCIGGSLNLVVGFGSIIGRQGLAGEAEYCIANDWLRIELERWAAANPGCRTQHIEWSVWSQIGMGVRMNVLESLRHQGVEPIEPFAGVAAMFDVLADVHAPVTVLVSSRFPASPTIDLVRPTESWLRFVERPKVDVPGVELVADCDLSVGSDPYLADHCVEGTPLLPAVVGMEAMAQAAAYLDGPAPRWCIRDVAFRSPIRVDKRDGNTVRIAGLQTDDHTEVVLRDGSDAFVSDRFVGYLTRNPGPIKSVNPATPPSDAARATSHPFYETLLFHGPRFHRLIDYETLSAFRVSAWIRASDSAPWFSEFYGQNLMLGDPGAHDATLHALLACLPHRSAIPTGVERMNLWHKPNGILQVRGRETSHSMDSFTFDVELVRPDGAVVAEWQGLQLRGLGPVRWPGGIPRRLVGPWLSRRLIECKLSDNVEIIVDDESSAVASKVARVGGERTWFDTSADTLVSALADHPVAVECVSVDDDVLPFLCNALDLSDRHTATALARAGREDIAYATARIWAARTAAAKLGRENGEAFRVDQVATDQLVVLVGGPMRVMTCLTHIIESDKPFVVAVAMEGRDAAV